ncbi:hypothetical protein PENSPDRAFT_740512 [Peniophora sp. CONT]|nr:hypothetical protein PENSPDRAFT_740512 [Peniophora sp. CONT]
MLNRPTPTCPGWWLGGQRTGVDDDLDKRERSAGTLTRVVFRPIRAFARLFLCVADSDVVSPSELTLVPDLPSNKEFAQDNSSCTALSTTWSDNNMGRSISGIDMGMPVYNRPAESWEEFYWTDSPPIIYSPGPLKFYVPVELFQLVLENIDSYPGYYVLLRKLRLVSRAWKSEADRFFLRDLGVANGHFVNFARALLANPRRGWHIRALRVDWALESAVQPDDVDVVRRAFMIMPNLEALTERCSSCDNLLATSIDAQILKGVPFRLRTWDTTFRWCPELEDILLEQTEIRKFVCSADLSFGTGPPEDRLATPGILPKCNLLDVGPGILPTFQNIGDVPSVRHLTFHVDALPPDCELVAAPGPRFIGSQLTSLVIVRISIQFAAFTPMPDLIREFIASVPNLLLFGIMDGQILTPRDNAQIRTMVCNHLPRLKTFCWAQNVYGTGEVEELDDEDMDGDDVESDDSEDEEDSDDEEETGERLSSNEKFGRYARKYFADHSALEYITAYFYRYHDPRLLIPPTRESSQWLYKRIWDDKHPDGYTVVDIDAPRLLPMTRRDLLDPVAPEDFIMRGYINPRRFIVPNPALPALPSDSDSD